MKKIKTVLIAFVLTLGTIGYAQAQEDAQVAHIASQKLIEMMPGYKSAMGELEQLQNTFSATLQDMYKETQGLNKKYQAEAATKTPAENKSRAQELQKAQQKIREFQQNAYKKLQAKEQELLKPVYEKARVAIQKVARAEGYEYVLDSTTGTGVLLADGYDLLPAVKKELGIQ